MELNLFDGRAPERRAARFKDRSQIAAMPKTIFLRDIAHARSGDKGNHANVGVIAWTAAGFEFLGRHLTEARVAEYFLPLRPRKVERFALPGIRAYNFVLFDVLGGGASRSLRTDSQGKVFAAALLEMQIACPANVGEMLQPHLAGPSPAG